MHRLLRISLRITPIALLLTVAAPLAAQGLPDQISQERPEPDAGPTKVSVGLYIIDISKINDVDQSMTADFVIRIRWRDPRLATDEPGVRTFGIQEIWSPRLTVANKRRLWKTWPDTVDVDQAGNVQFRQRFFGTLTARLDLHDFPFDRNTVMIQLLTAGVSPAEVELVMDESVTGRASDFSLVDAAIGPGSVTTGTYFFAPSNVHLPSLTYSFEVRRYTAYYLWKIILPLTIIVFMSWLVFWIDAKQFGPQVGLAATAVLTLIAYRFLLGSLVPRISYLTRLDIFIMGATVLVFLGMVEAVASAKIALKNEKRARRVDRVSRVAFPAAFVVATYFAFFA
jgi:hypothetical protein